MSDDPETIYADFATGKFWQGGSVRELQQYIRKDLCVPTETLERWAGWTDTYEQEDMHQMYDELTAIIAQRNTTHG